MLVNEAMFINARFAFARADRDVRADEIFTFVDHRPVLIE